MVSKNDTVYKPRLPHQHQLNPKFRHGSKNKELALQCVVAWCRVKIKRGCFARGFAGKRIPFSVDCFLLAVDCFFSLGENGRLPKLPLHMTVQSGRNLRGECFGGFW